VPDIGRPVVRKNDSATALLLLYQEGDGSGVLRVGDEQGIDASGEVAHDAAAVSQHVRCGRAKAALDQVVGDADARDADRRAPALAGKSPDRPAARMRRCRRFLETYRPSLSRSSAWTRRDP